MKSNIQNPCQFHRRDKTPPSWPGLPLSSADIRREHLQHASLSDNRKTRREEGRMRPHEVRSVSRSSQITLRSLPKCGAVPMKCQWAQWSPGGRVRAREASASADCGRTRWPVPCSSEHSWKGKTDEAIPHRRHLPDTCPSWRRSACDPTATHESQHPFPQIAPHIYIHWMLQTTIITTPGIDWKGIIAY